MNKLTQHDLCVLYLIGRDGWTHGYEMKGREFGNYFIGSEADTRLYELFDKNVTDQEEKTAKREISGAEYTIITKKLHGRRVYKAFLSREAPKKKKLVYDEVTGTVSYALMGEGRITNSTYK